MLEFTDEELLRQKASRVDELESENERLRAERDLAVAHADLNRQSSVRMTAKVLDLDHEITRLRRELSGIEAQAARLLEQLYDRDQELWAALERNAEREVEFDEGWRTRQEQLDDPSRST